MVVRIVRYEGIDATYHQGAIGIVWGKDVNAHPFRKFLKNAEEHSVSLNRGAAIDITVQACADYDLTVQREAEKCDGLELYIFPDEQTSKAREVMADVGGYE